MAKPQVTLTFAGDADKLERTFDSVGASAKAMSDDVGKASKDVGASFDRVGEAADNTEQRAMGFRDTLTGVQDTSAGLSQIMKGDLFGGVLTLGAGVGDLASGFANFLIPAMKNASIGMLRNAADTAKSTAANTAHKVSSLASTGATWAQTTAQRALNAAMKANPIVLVVSLLAALVGAIVLAYKKSETFRNIVDGAMRGARTAIGWVLDKGKELLGWFGNLAGKISAVGGPIVEAISWPYRQAFNAIAWLWNNTAGRLSFTAPDWIPGIGGKGFSMPQLPQLAEGGIVKARNGGTLVVAGEGGQDEAVVPLDGRPLGEVHLHFHGPVADRQQAARWVKDALREAGYLNGAAVA